MEIQLSSDFDHFPSPLRWYWVDSSIPRWFDCVMYWVALVLVWTWPILSSLWLHFGITWVFVVSFGGYSCVIWTFVWLVIELIVIYALRWAVTWRIVGTIFHPLLVFSVFPVFFFPSPFPPFQPIFPPLISSHRGLLYAHTSAAVFPYPPRCPIRGATSISPYTSHVE